jgi:hypothetical protein
LLAVLVVDGMGRGLGQQQNGQCWEDEFVHFYVAR